MTEVDLRPDCANCDALCCVLLAFDASTAFAFSKPACTACRNLSDDNTCNLHADLPGHGFSGCHAFDCQGAGQRVTSQVFQGRSWRDDPNHLPQIENAFRAMRRLHAAVALLHQAALLPLTQDQRQAHLTVSNALDANRTWTEAELHALETGPELKAVAAYLASLRCLDGLSPPHR